MRNLGSVLVAVAIIVHSAAAYAASSPALTCQTGKLGIAGKYGACRLSTEAKALKAGASPDFTKCQETFSGKWTAAESKATQASGSCLDPGDESDIKDLIDGHSADVETALAGGGLPAQCGNALVESGEDCDVGNLNSKTCVTQGFVGGTLTCAAGCTFDTSHCYNQRFDDSGATIIDRETGLEWEKKDGTDGVPNPADLHDVDNVYTWSSTAPAADGSAFVDFLSKLNGESAFLGSYAHHTDWRLPTATEAAVIPEFTDAVPGPPPSGPWVWEYWSSTALDSTTAFASDNTGSPAALDKTQPHLVRAVRGGS